MATLTRRRSRLSVALVALAAALALVATAYALTAPSFKYSSPKTGYVRVSHMAFGFAGVPVGTFNNLAGGGLFVTSGSSCFTAGVDLPVGSRVRAITFYFKPGPTPNFFGNFWWMQLAKGDETPLAGVQGHDNPGTITSATGHVPAAKQRVRAGRAYQIDVCPGSGGHFYGARVKYTYMSAGS